MNCDEIRSLVSLSLDRELDWQSEKMLAEHLDNCVGCRNHLAQQQATQGKIRAAATYHRAPTDLLDRINSALPEEALPDLKRSGSATRGGWRFVWQLLNGAGLAVAACAVLILAVVIPLRPSMEEVLRDEIVSSHARSLLTQHVMDVASSDQHTVKPWFNGKLDFSPPVRDFAEQGFPLLGGRLDYIDHRGVAVVVYRRHQHIINVFIWPSIDKAPSLQSTQGYHLANKTAGGMNFVAISDIDPVELKQLVEML
jgi:anti-sigma factor RsiW